MVFKSNACVFQKVKAVVYGHAVADALGVPVEFLDRRELVSNPVTGMMGFGSHPVPAGTWSDDTSMAIATLDSLAGGIDYSDIMDKFAQWKTKAAYTATNEVFDMGISTNNAISRYQRGTSPLECGCSGENDNGNGSLMRIYPAVLYMFFSQNACFSRDAFQTVIFKMSALTHAHLRSELACTIYAFILLSLLRGGSIADGISEVKEQLGNKAEYACELQHFSRLFSPEFQFTDESEIQSSGYVVASLEAAVWCVLNTNSYRECVLKAVNLGKDTDTVGAIAGSLAGCIYGTEGIPEDWLECLKNKELLDRICTHFSAGLMSCSV